MQKKIDFRGYIPTNSNVDLGANELVFGEKGGVSVPFLSQQDTIIAAQKIINFANSGASKPPPRRERKLKPQQLNINTEKKRERKPVTDIANKREDRIKQPPSALPTRPAKKQERNSGIIKSFFRRKKSND